MIAHLIEVAATPGLLGAAAHQFLSPLRALRRYEAEKVYEAMLYQVTDAYWNTLDTGIDDTGGTTNRKSPDPHGIAPGYYYQEVMRDGALYHEYRDGRSVFIRRP
jgi:hypothetical protein